MYSVKASFFDDGYATQKTEKTAEYIRYKELKSNSYSVLTLFNEYIQPFFCCFFGSHSRHQKMKL